MIVDSSQGLTKLPRCSWFFLLTTLNWSHWNSICLRWSLTLNHSVSNQIDGENKERNGGARVCRQPRREKKSFSTLSLIWIGFFSGRERERERERWRELWSGNRHRLLLKWWKRKQSITAFGFDLGKAISGVGQSGFSISLSRAIHTLR